MISYNVTIPESKESFLKEFLEMIGADYHVERNADYQLSEEHRQILDERLKADKMEFIPARDALNKLRKKYEL